MFVARAGRSELTTTVLEPGQLQDLVERMLKSSGRRVDLSQPFVDAMLADGSRLHVVIPDIIGGVALTCGTNRQPAADLHEHRCS